MMSRTATRATAALLCGVVLVALGLAIAGMPETQRAPESLSVEIDFDTFVPGVTQTRTSTVDVPVPSQVAEARAATSGADAAIDVDLTICQLARCTPLTPGLELDPGPYTLTVAATMDPDVEQGASADLVGLIRVVETRRSTTVDPTLMMTTAGIGLLAVAGGLVLVGRRKVMTP